MSSARRHRRETRGVRTLHDRVVHKLEYQSKSCLALGSPLYEALLAAAADDAAARGPVWTVLEPYAADPGGSAMALRFMGAVHRLVLAGRAPKLAEFYPSAGGAGSAEDAAGAFLETVATHVETLRRDTGSPLQTNEVARSAALVGGFLTVASRFGLPLDVLEVGASAGLNLRWDRYLYEARGRTWGDGDSPVRLCNFNTERIPPFDVAASVAGRRGCDPRPIDPATDEGATRLLSFVWPDQMARIRLLRAAIEVARRVPAPVDEAPASTWLEEQLPRRRGDVATVVFHSIVLPYLDDDERRAMTSALVDAGAGATPQAPLGYLRMEPSEHDGDLVEVRLTTWPGGADEVLAHTGYHGSAVRWLGS